MMTAGARLVSAGLLLATVSSGLEPNQASDDTVVAIFDDRQITLGDLMFRFASLSATQRERYVISGGLERFLEDLLSSFAVVEQARRANLEDDPLFERLMEIRREQVLADLFARRTLLGEIDSEVIEGRYLETAGTRFHRSERVHVRHLLLTKKTERKLALQQLESLARELAAGADFEALTREHSRDASAEHGGDLGWLALDELSPALAKAVTTLEPGGVSGPVESDLGFHLVQLIDRTPAVDLPIGVVEELLYQEVVGERWLDLAEQARQQKTKLLEKHQVVIHDHLIP